MTRALSLALALVLPALAGCSVFKGGALFGGDTAMTVVVDPDLNLDSPVAVDVLFVYDQSLVATLKSKPASDWFKNREQFLRDNPDGAVESSLWEWVPGQGQLKQTLSYRIGVFATFVFASYSTPGEHRVQLEPGSKLLLTLGPTDFQATPGG